jgi:hypothetical protein
MKSATVYKRSDGWYLHGDSQTTVGVWIEMPPRIKLDNNVSPSDLGNAAHEVLAESKQGVPHPTVDELETGFKPMLELAGVKSWAAFARHACNVSIRTDSDSRFIIIEPWENAGTKRGFVQMPNLSVRVRMDAPPAEIGEAIQKAMQLCVPQFP